jgi:hypothetical protein
MARASVTKKTSWITLTPARVGRQGRLLEQIPAPHGGQHAQVEGSEGEREGRDFRQGIELDFACIFRDLEPVS